MTRTATDPAAGSGPTAGPARKRRPRVAGPAAKAGRQSGRAPRAATHSARSPVRGDRGDRPVVLKPIARSSAVGDAVGCLRDDECPLSENSVSGPTISVPIAGTCQPSKVCVRDCYAASNHMATPEALAKQYRVQHSMEADPIAFAGRVVAEYDKRGLTYLRWNGVGDLTPSSVAAINHIIATRPDVTLWIVTRLPEMAAMIEQGPNAYVHFSLDGSSLERRERLRSLQPKTTNYFWSYQCGRDEVPPSDLGVSVLFHRRYKPAAGSDTTDPATCPLNTLTNCVGACAACRRCFNGDAVRMRLAAEEVAR